MVSKAALRSNLTVVDGASHVVTHGQHSRLRGVEGTVGGLSGW